MTKVTITLPPCFDDLMLSMVKILPPPQIDDAARQQFLAGWLYMSFKTSGYTQLAEEFRISNYSDISDVQPHP